jgi:hypothetical protein
VGPRAGLDSVEYKEISCNAGNQTPTVQPTAHHYTNVLTFNPSMNLSSLFHLFNYFLPFTTISLAILCFSCCYLVPGQYFLSCH